MLYAMGIYTSCSLGFGDMCLCCEVSSNFPLVSVTISIAVEREELPVGSPTLVFVES